MNKEEIIKKISAEIKWSAECTRMNAGYDGRMDDGGASKMEEYLKYWLDGIAFAESGKTSVYESILQTIEKESDPEYLEFNRLKEKFKK